MAKQTIALVYDAIYPFCVGGAERRFYEMGLRLSASGYDVHLYGMKYWDGPRVITRDGLTLHGLCQARPLYTSSGRRSISQALIFGLASFKLIGERFDIIDCCGFPYFSLFGAKLAALAARKPLHVTWHEVWGKLYWKKYLGSLGILGYAVEKLAAKLPNHIIAVSSDTATKLKRDLGATCAISIIPNGISVGDIAAVPANKNQTDLIYTGRLVDFKHIDQLIEAVSLLAPAHPDLKLTIVGDGPMRTTLEQQVKQLQLQHRVTFTGFLQESSEVYARMKSARIFVLPSSREGFGISLIEANAAGLPVITVDHPANAAKDLITPATGFIAKPTAESLAQTIERALSHPLNPANCQAYARTFDWDPLTKQLIKALS